MNESECAKHRYSPLIRGFGFKQFLACQDCSHYEEITPEMEAGWVAHYQQCVASGVEYHGVMGDYVP